MEASWVKGESQGKFPTRPSTWARTTCSWPYRTIAQHEKMLGALRSLDSELADHHDALGRIKIMEGQMMMMKRRISAMVYRNGPSDAGIDPRRNAGNRGWKGRRTSDWTAVLSGPSFAHQIRDFWKKLTSKDRRAVHQ